MPLSSCQSYSQRRVSYGVARKGSCLLYFLQVAMQLCLDENDTIQEFLHDRVLVRIVRV